MENKMKMRKKREAVKAGQTTLKNCPFKGSGKRCVLRQFILCFLLQNQVHSRPFSSLLCKFLFINLFFYCVCDF